MVLTYLRLSAVLLCLCGYILFLSKKGLEIAFAPAVTVSAIGLIIFLAGLLNLMPQAAAVVLIGGLLLCGYYLIRRQPLELHSLAVVSFFLIAIGVLSILYHDTAFTGPDDFSHWALVTKNLLMNDRLPMDGDILYYQSYPTGTAGFLYFVCKVTGLSEPNMLRAQTILIVSGMCSLWAFVKKRHSVCTILISLFSLFLLLSFGNARTLVVDLVLTLLGAASFLLLLFYRKDPQKAWWGNCILLSYLVLVKNSSLFFVFLHLLPVLYFTYSDRKYRQLSGSRKTYWIALVLNLLIPIGVYLLWDRHAAQAFPAGNLSRHSLSIPYLLETFSEKSLTDIRSVFVAFAYRSIQVGFEIPAFLATLGIFVFGWVLRRKSTPGSRPPEAFYLLWGLVAFGAWMLGVLGMYLFSMPYAEAITLGSYDRYVGTIAVYLLSIAFVYLLDTVSQGQALPLPATVIASGAVLVMLCSVWSAIPSLYQNIPFKSNARDVLTEIRERYDIPSGSSYCLITDDWGLYAAFIARYDFWSGAAVAESDPLNLSEPGFLQECDHLILLREGEDVDQFLDGLGIPRGEQYYYLPHYR